MYAAAVLTVSDRGARGERPDKSGPLIVGMLEAAGYQVIKTAVVPDEQGRIEDVLKEWADGPAPALIITTGGTGFSPRDVTPEATIAVCRRMTPGIPEAMRYASLQITPRAILSRAQAGIRGGTLIVNLPGSPKAAKENLEAVLTTLDHGLNMLLGGRPTAARPERPAFITGAGIRLRVQIFWMDRTPAPCYSKEGNPPAEAGFPKTVWRNDPWTQCL